MKKSGFFILTIFAGLIFVLSFSVSAYCLPIVSVGDIIINEFLADPPSGLEGDANGDGVRSSSGDEFIELVNTTGDALDISGFMIKDSVSVRHTFAPGTVIGAGESIVVFGGGLPGGSFGGAQVFTASEGSLSLNNSGDTISLLDTLDAVIDSVTYGSEGGNDQSLTRSPDITGAFTPHTTALGSGGAAFSPGTKIDGTPFTASVPVPEPSTLLLFGWGILGLAVRRQEGQVYTLDKKIKK